MHFLPIDPQTSFSLYLFVLVALPFSWLFFPLVKAAAALNLNQHRSHKVLSGLLFSLKETLAWAECSRGGGQGSFGDSSICSDTEDFMQKRYTVPSFLCLQSHVDFLATFFIFWFCKE